MPIRNLGYEQMHSEIWPEFDESPPSRVVRHASSCRAARAQRSYALPPRRLFLPVAFIAVIGEVAALALASVLHLGPAATAFALAGVVLASMWPLVRSAT
ncbi:MAG TPA: hypothetical protein VGR47_17985 [Terracidiphilus sp.]|nr:hypothetical protein [Terracidiphilus sp.]